MWNKKLQEIKKMNAIFGEEINDGATDKDIQRFLEEIGDIISVEKLYPYINVLKRVNGRENIYFLETVIQVGILMIY